MISTFVNKGDVQRRTFRLSNEIDIGRYKIQTTKSFLFSIWIKYKVFYLSNIGKLYSLFPKYSKLNFLNNLELLLLKKNMNNFFLVYKFSLFYNNCYNFKKLFETLLKLFENKLRIRFYLWLEDWFEEKRLFQISFIYCLEYRNYWYFKSCLKKVLVPN